MESSYDGRARSDDMIPGTLVIVAPRNNSGGVGDYAEDFGGEVSRYFSNFRQVRTGGPGQVGLLDILRDRRHIRRILRDSRSDGPVVLHFELSAGSISPFWLVAGNRGTLTTATVHDPPYSVWWPFRTRLLARSRFATHGLHYPMRKFSGWIERTVLRGVVLIALSDMGSDALKRTYPSCEVLTARHFVPNRPTLPAASTRPLAVGLFGHAYKGKGFDKLLDLRKALPPEIAISVAGRGTEQLPPVEGVNVLGGVDGEAEDAFFASVRAILLPYANTSRYGEILSVSGVAARCFAYGTPVIAAQSGTLSEAARHGGLRTAPNTIESIAVLACDTVSDDAALARIAQEALQLRKSRTIDKAVQPYIQRWGEVVTVYQS